MTDDELLAVVQSKSPEELTAEEISLLRRRLAESETLRTALFDTLQMEAYLATALAPVQLDPERLVERAGQLHEDRAKAWTWIVAGLGCVAFLALGFGAFRAALNHGNPPVAQATPPAQDDEATSAADANEAESAANEPTTDAGPAETAPAAESSDQPGKAAPPVAPPKPPDAPWHAVLSLAADQLPAFEEICFQDFAYRSVLPTQQELGLWFEAAPAQALRIVDTTTKKGKCGKIEGFARLKAPLPVDGGFRFALEDYNRLAIHAYHGTQGVLLMYFEDQRQKWVAYSTTRKPGELKYETLVLTATDAERARRAELRFGGPLELRYHAGELLLVRGDIVLVRAPLSGPPEEIYFEGKASFEGITLVRSKDFPLAREAEPPSVRLRPGDLAWKEKLPEGAKFERQADGAVKLTSREPKEHPLVHTPLPGIGYREAIFELSDVSPGFSVCLVHEPELVRHVIRVVRNGKSKRLNVVLRGPDDYSEGNDFHPLKERPEQASGQNLWIKLLHGNGCLTWWTSADGVHWAIGETIPEDSPGQITAIGLHNCRTKQEATGTLKSLTVRELPALNALAPADLLKQAPAITKHATLGAWMAEVVQSCPRGVELSAWRRACAVRSLGSGVPRALSPQLLEALLDDPGVQALPLESQLNALREVMLVETDPRDNALWKRGYLTRIHELGRRIAAEGGMPFSSVRRTLMQSATHTPHQLLVAAQGQPEEELVQLLQRGRLEEAVAFCVMVRLFHFNENRPLFAWGEAAARREAGRVTGESSRIKESWRHPLVEELNKEVYNFAADLHSVMESGAMDDASQMIASLETDRGGGLTPSGADRNLFVSLVVAVKLAIAKEPALRQQLNKQLAPLAQLRVRQAVASGDEASIALAATQFEGTEAAAEAHRWLGDRALHNGWFARALAEYARATASAGPSLTHELEPRARLAAAMMGLEHGSVITQPVSFGDVQMAPGEFEALVAEMKTRGTAKIQGAVATLTGALPGPSQLQAHNRGRVDGPAGQNPHEDGAPRISQWLVDYAGRQIATAVEGDVLYVSNRFHVAAYNATSGQRLWQSQPPSGEMRRGQDWSLIPMRPLVTGSALYVRQLYGKSPSLVCFEKAGGKKLWQREGTDNEWWVSDPVFVQGQLLALNVLRDGNREMQLRLASLDPVTGDVLVQRRLVGLRESWRFRKHCEITPLDDGLIATLGGLTLCCDAAGDVRWLRKQLALPHEERPEWVWQYFAPPLLIGSQVVSIQPGVEVVECLDTATGRQLWTFSEDRPRRILGASGDRVIVETDRQIVALGASDGKAVWRREESFSLETGHTTRLTAALADEKFVAYMVKRGAADRPKTPALVWLDATDGRYLGTIDFPQWTDNDPRIGPLVTSKDRLWTFFSKEKDPNKDLVELTPGAPLASAAESRITAWQRTLSEPLVQVVREVAAGWELASGYPRKDLEKKAEWQGEKDAALILARPDMPGVLTQEIDLPAGKQPKLNLRVGHEGNPPGQFTVRVDGETVFTQEWKADGANRWDALNFDLAKYAGRKVLISLTYLPTTGADHAWWVKTASVSWE